VSNVF